jgi:hypothetical protein
VLCSSVLYCHVRHLLVWGRIFVVCCNCGRVLPQTGSFLRQPVPSELLYLYHTRLQVLFS